MSMDDSVRHEETPIAKKEMQQEEIDEKPIQHKETFKRTSIEPDVVIVVGGTEFREYSVSLCSWSDFFDTALRSGMKESDTKRFEFPNRDPKEWAWIISLMAPMAREKVTKETIRTALSWFDELASEPGLLECDRVLQERIATYVPTAVESQAQQEGSEMIELTGKEMQQVVNAFCLSIRYRLVNSKTSILHIIRHILDVRPTLFTTDMLEEICGAVKDDAEALEDLGAWLADFLPPTCATMEKMAQLAQAEVLHEIVHLGIMCQEERRLKEKERRLKEEERRSKERLSQVKDRIVELIDSSDGSRIAALKSKLKYDDKMKWVGFPSHW